MDVRLEVAMRVAGDCVCAGLLTVALSVVGATPASGQLRSRVVASGYSQPVALVQDPEDPSVQYVLERAGRVRILRGGAPDSGIFLDISGETTTDGERGLLGMAFPPNAAASRRVFVNFTNRLGHTVVARFRRSASNPLRIDPATRFDLLWPDGRRFIEQPFSNHNGGALRFGPDGHLYIALGDGGAGNDPGHRAQDPNTLLGKMLRIDVAVPDDDPRGYRLPADNPFLDGEPVRALGEIWAFGLRNPWRFSFDDPSRGGTGGLFIGDVGQSAREEVDFEPRATGGRNYGWRNREGTLPGAAGPSPPPAYLPLTDPIHDYPRTIGRSITGGYVYRGVLLGPRYQGRYFFADFITGRVFSVGLSYGPSGDAEVVDLVDHTQELGGTARTGNVVSIDVDAAGELYVVNFGGSVLRIEPPPSLAVVVRGPGQVVLSPPGFTCSGSCGHSYTSGAVVTLVPIPSSGARFVAWSGDADCADGVVTVQGGVSCIATFHAPRNRDRGGRPPRRLF